MRRFGWMCPRKLFAPEFPDDCNVGPAVSRQASTVRSSQTVQSARIARVVLSGAAMMISACCRLACANTKPRRSRWPIITGRCRFCGKLTATAIEMRCLAIYPGSSKTKCQHDSDQERKGNRENAAILPHCERDPRSGERADSAWSYDKGS